MHKYNRAQAGMISKQLQQKTYGHGVIRNWNTKMGAEECFGQNRTISTGRLHFNCFVFVNREGAIVIVG